MRPSLLPCPQAQLARGLRGPRDQRVRGRLDQCESLSRLASWNASVSASFSNGNQVSCARISRTACARAAARTSRWPRPVRLSDFPNATNEGYRAFLELQSDELQVSTLRMHGR